MLRIGSPLEDADTPSLDELAQKGETGLLEGDVSDAIAGLLDARSLQQPDSATILGALAESERVIAYVDAVDPEETDRVLFGALLRALDLSEFVIAVLAERDGRPALLLVSSGSFEPEGALQFGETDAARGRLGRVAGVSLGAKLVSLAGEPPT